MSAPILDPRARQYQRPNPYAQNPPNPALNPQMGPPRPQIHPKEAEFNRWSQDMRAQSQYPRDKKGQLFNFLGSALTGLALGELGGGSFRDSAIFGLGTAASNYQQQKGMINQIEQQIANARAQLSKQMQEYDKVNQQMRIEDFKMQHPHLFGGASNPGQLEKKIQAVESINGTKRGTDEFMKDWQKFGSPSDTQALMAILQNPALLGAAFDQSSSAAAGRESGKLGVMQAHALSSSLANVQNSITRFEGLKSGLEGLDTNAFTGEVKGKFVAEYQAMRSALIDNGLQQIAAYAEQGVRLNPITENELRLLLAASPELSNDPRANIAIIDRELEKAKKIEADIIEQLEWIDAGKRIEDWRPKRRMEDMIAADPSYQNATSEQPRVITVE